MSGIGDQGLRPAGVESPPPDDADGVDAEDSPVTGEVPAGRAGADAGAADAVRIDPEDDTEIPDSSEMNDEPGVGPRRPRT